MGQERNGPAWTGDRPPAAIRALLLRFLAVRPGMRKKLEVHQRSRLVDSLETGGESSLPSAVTSPADSGYGIRCAAHNACVYHARLWSWTSRMNMRMPEVMTAVYGRSRIQITSAIISSLNPVRQSRTQLQPSLSQLLTEQSPLHNQTYQTWQLQRSLTLHRHPSHLMRSTLTARVSG